MSTDPRKIKIPPDPSQINGTTKAKAVNVEAVTSAYGQAQVKVTFETVKGMRLSGYFTVDNPKHVAILLQAGVYRQNADGFAEFVEVAKQPFVTITVKAGKVKEITSAAESLF